MGKVAIHWFRQDLRLADNPALLKACESSQVLPIYILDDINSNEYAMGGASRWWLYHSLKSLNQSLNESLSVYVGDPEEIFKDLIDRFDVESVYWNRCYESWRIQRDERIKKNLKDKGVTVQSFKASLLWEPWEVSKADRTPYKVFYSFLSQGMFVIRISSFSFTRA